MQEAHLDRKGRGTMTTYQQSGEVGSYGLGRTQPCGRATFRRLLLMHQTKEVSYYCSLKPPLIQCRAGVGNLPTVMCQIVIFFPELEFKNAGRNFAGANRRCLSKRQHAANQLIGSILPLTPAEDSTKHLLIFNDLSTLDLARLSLNEIFKRHACENKDLCLLCERSYKTCQGSRNTTNKRRWKKSCLACSGKSSTSSVDAPSHRCLVRSFKRLLKFTISGALLLNKDYGVLRSTVYYFIKCFSGEGDLEVKLLALCGKVTTFDNFGAYLFHLPTPPRPRTCRGAAAVR
ncbi:hypothetical protein Anapl_02938 [Anas platyrhynchos]|uniref:Uncharacterized protein n=1 Tax=Anas platyrhynchos TaxID=8839 RepID=R0LER6_ANAPL|nr:hypothetical protein Anapl_02938 [Anas platyrhynchos]